MIQSREILVQVSWSNVASILFVITHSVVFFYVAHSIESDNLGIYALASGLIMIAIGIVENSFSNSLIYKNDIEPKDLQSVFTLNLYSFIVLSFLLTLGLLTWYSLNKNLLLIQMTLFLWPSVLIAAINSIMVSCLKIKLKFKSLAKVELLSNICYLIVLTFLLNFSFGIWSLAIAILIKYLTSFIYLIVIKDSPPLLSVIKLNKKISTHWQYGKYILAEKSLSSIISHTDTIVVSHFFGWSILGHYDVLKRIVLRPVVLLYSGAEQVFFTLFSKYKHSPNSFTLVYKELNNISKFVFLNGLLLITINSDIVLSFLPPSYFSYNKVLHALLAFCVAYILINPIDILLYSVGKTKEFLYWISSYTLPLILVYLISSQWSLEIMLWSVVVFYFSLYLISYPILIKNFQIKASLYYSTFLYSLALALLLLLFLEFFAFDLFLRIFLSLSIILISFILLFYNNKKASSILRSNKNKDQ